MLTYDEYLQMGGTLDRTAYARQAFKAQKAIEYHTFKRATPTKSVKRLMFELIDYYHNSMIGFKQFSNDGVSMTMADSSLEVYDLIAEYLINERAADGTPLLYLGVK